MARKKYQALPELSETLAAPGTHLGGLVFAPKDMKPSEVMPLEMSGTPGLSRTQYDKDDLEGVLRMPKLDLLGLRTHTSLRKAGELVSKKLGRTIEPLSPHPMIRTLTGSFVRAGPLAYSS